MPSELSQRILAEQRLMFSISDFLPDHLPTRSELQAAPNLSSIFDDIHNYIYANEGILKDKIFHEVVRLLALKLHDEEYATPGEIRFGITSSEYAFLLQNAESPFLARLQELQAEVASRFPYIRLDQPFSLRPLTLGNAVAKLQFVSLRDTPRDAKGEAFQSFVYRHQRGDRGEFFTPIPIVRLAVDILSPAPSHRIIDPACGSGGFLVEAISHVATKYPDVDRTSFIQKNVVGIEFNPDVALAAMLRLAFEGATGREIICSNSLHENPELDTSFDLVFTNPPFGSKGKVEDRAILGNYELARRWKASSTSDWAPTPTVLPGQTPEILFIEKCIRLLRPGGRLAIVLPEGILQNVSYSHVRSWIRREATPIAVVSIPQEAFVPYGTGIKTSLLVVQKGQGTSPSSAFMARIHKIGYDVKGQPTYRHHSRKAPSAPLPQPTLDEDVTAIARAFKADAGDRGQLTDVDCFSVPLTGLNSRLDVDHYRPNDQEMIRRLVEAGSRPLASVARILQDPDTFRTDGTQQIKYIAISDVDAHTMTVVSAHHMPPAEAPSRATYRLKQGDIITAISGANTGTPQQATAIIAAQDDGAICSNGFAVLRDFTGVDPYYLLAFMRSDVFLNQVRRLMTGHAIPAISTSDLAQVLIPIPPDSDQHAIASTMKASIEACRQAASLATQAFSSTQQFLRRLNS